MDLDWPLMMNNITRDDLDELIEFLKGQPILTQSANVRALEDEWSQWLGVKHSLFVNSGSSANLITMAALRTVTGPGEVIVSPLGWVSDVAAVLQCGFKPVFADINLRTLCMDTAEILRKVTPETRAVLLVHAQGFNGLTDELLAGLAERGIALVEDVCESHGATHKGRKLGSFGLLSNFSFYYAHHMSTIEGGMVCTNDENLYQIARMLRSHGMVRESTSDEIKKGYAARHPDLNPDFIFAYPAWNMRNTEIGAVLGRGQLKRLDSNNARRRANFELFLSLLDPDRYQTDFELEGSCNYAFNLILKNPDPTFRDRVMERLRECRVEFRRGSAGGGNQLRQPYLRGIVPDREWEKYPHLEHIHFFGFYIGNYPDLPEDKIRTLCRILNEIPC